MTVDGRSYGLMGTDLYGRPIQLGVLLGLPYALELGAVTSVAAVLFGVVFGGISGFIGGRRDGVMQWFTLVFLALPALPFLVATLLQLHAQTSSPRRFSSRRSLGRSTPSSRGRWPSR